MNEPRDGLLAIGAFASAAQLSLKALRLYAQLGILLPSYVDPDSGYRYYSAGQLAQARLIRALRQIDMPLASIRRVLTASSPEAEQLVLEYCQELEARAAQARQAVPDLIIYLRKESPPMAHEVTVRSVAPQRLISITRRVKVDQLDTHIRESLDRLHALVAAGGGSVAGAPFGIYHGPINTEDDGPLEVCLPIARPLASTGEVEAGELAAGKVATVMLTGAECDFPAILAGYDAAYDWIRANGYEAAGPPREIWHSAPGADARMEIALPFREA
jgi:DNA-binding transcriptional MerR regulator